MLKTPTWSTVSDFTR